MNFEKLSEIVGKAKKLPKKIEYATTIRKEGDSIVIRQHETDIVKAMPSGRFELHMGGWNTKTTRERLSRYSPVQVFTERGVAWVRANGKTIPFEEGMVVDQNGKAFNVKIKASAQDKSVRMVSKMVKKYIDGFCEHVQKNGLENPGGGDCWLCLFPNALQYDKDNPDHLFEHMKESYFVPSLLFNAMKERLTIQKPAWGSPTERNDATEVAARSFLYAVGGSGTWMMRNALRQFFRRRMQVLVRYAIGMKGGNS